MARYRTYTPNDEQPLMDGDEQFIGVNMRLKPDKVQPGFMAYGTQNVRFRQGEAQTRLGLAKPVWLNKTDTVNSPGKILHVGQHYGVGNFKDPDSIEYTIIAADGSIYRHVPGNQRVQVQMPAGVMILSRCSFTQAFNQLYCFRGRDLAPLVCSDLETGFLDLVPQWSASATYNAAVQALSSTADQMAYGPYVAVTSLTYTGSSATVVTTAPHGYVTGADVTLAGATPNYFNDRWNITVLDDYTFTLASVNYNGSGTASGTITVSNNRYYWQALGSQATNSTITESSSTVTVTTTADHGFAINEYVTITGATPAGYNGTWLITGVTSNTYTFTGTSGLGSATTAGLSQSSVVQAGQSPDTTPGAWQQIFNVLPNADDAVYVNNELLVPTAYTPGNLGYNAENNSYTKKDYLVVTDVNDLTHFDDVNGIFRINEGSDDEIQALVVYNDTTVLVLKNKSWGILTGIGNLTSISLNMFGATYGACALRSAVTAGEDVLFPSPVRGICSCYMTQLGEVRGTDTPFSNELQKMIARINWNYAAGIRMAWWNDCLYTAAPLDDATLQGPAVVSSAAVYNNSYMYGNTSNYFNVGVTPGATYQVTLGANEVGFVNGQITSATNPGTMSTSSATIVAAGSYIGFYGNAAGASATATVNLITPVAIPAGFPGSSFTNGGTKYLYYNLGVTMGDVYQINLFGNRPPLWVNGVIPLGGINPATGNNTSGTVTAASTYIGFFIAEPRVAPIDATVNLVGPDLISGQTYSSSYIYGPAWYYYNLPVTRGATYQITLGANEVGFINGLVSNSVNPITATMNNATIVAAGTSIGFYATSAEAVTAVVTQVYVGNNALLVYDYRMGYSGSPLTYDFRGGQWAGPDIGPFCVLEFFTCTVNGLLRLCFIGADGYVSMLDEHTNGDQVYSPDAPDGLQLQPIETICVSRGYRPKDPKAFDAQQRFRRMQLVVGTLNPDLTITANTGAGFSEQTLVDGLTFDKTTYYKPFDAPPWNPTNVNADFQTPGRYDYSVTLASGGTVLTGGLNLSTMQEMTKRVSLRPLQGRYAQFTISSSQGQIAVRSIGPESVEGPRRNGVLI